ncbi:MAG TPA: hypothetical protein VGM44_19300 [Polyangiaceae bacterium]|jgi:hypothetical protein
MKTVVRVGIALSVLGLLFSTSSCGSSGDDAAQSVDPCSGQCAKAKMCQIDVSASCLSNCEDIHSHAKGKGCDTQLAAYDSCMNTATWFCNAALEAQQQTSCQDQQDALELCLP